MTNGLRGGKARRMSEIEQFYPRLVVEGADDALAFYAKAFGGEVTERYADGGRVLHAMVVAGPARFAVKDAGDGDPAPSGGGVSVIMALYVADPDAVAAAHARRRRAGDLPGGRPRLRRARRSPADPWGHQWMLAKRLT